MLALESCKGQGGPGGIILSCTESEMLFVAREWKGKLVEAFLPNPDRASLKLMLDVFFVLADSRDSQEVSYPCYPVQEVFGSSHEHSEPMSALLRALHQAKRVQGSTDV